MISGQVSNYFSSFRQAQVKFSDHLSESVQLTCQLLIKSPDVLLAHFPEEIFSPLQIDQNSNVYFFCAGYDELFHINARIDKILGERELQLIILGVRTYPQRRRFFRIDAEVMLRYWPLEDLGPFPTEPQQKRVNLSAVGMRFVTSQPLRHVEMVGLELQLGEKFGVVSCIARVVRINVIVDNHLESVAVDFEGIKPEEQEKIIRFCLNEQSRQIRHKVRVLDLWVG